MPLSPSIPLIKVCGLRDADNIAAVAALQPDFMGFVFCQASPRYAGNMLQPGQLQTLPTGIRKVGVFVDEPSASILTTARRYGLDVVQLHGQERPEQCAELRAAELQVIKAFSVGEEINFDRLEPYSGVCDYFLLDTKGPAPGGNGRPFDWQLLRGYHLRRPYLLAGGIAPEHAATLAGLRLPGLIGIDLNSRFETEPGLKDPALLTPLFAALRPAQ
jgi:phosphoribosylanthranilate isomerase